MKQVNHVKIAKGLHEIYHLLLWCRLVQQDIAMMLLKPVAINFLKHFKPLLAKVEVFTYTIYLHCTMEYNKGVSMPNVSNFL